MFIFLYNVCHAVTTLNSFEIVKKKFVSNRFPGLFFGGGGVEERKRGEKQKALERYTRERTKMRQKLRN